MRHSPILMMMIIILYYTLSLHGHHIKKQGSSDVTQLSLFRLFMVQLSVMTPSGISAV